jgi:acetolactate synthase-1/2/3 large subunit
MSAAQDEVRALAEALAMPVLTSLAGRGSIPDDHVLSVGGLGAHRNPLSKDLFLNADVIVGVGTRFEEMETNWRDGFLPAKDAAYIQIDIDPEEHGRSVIPRHPIIGDARTVLRQMLDIVRAGGRAISPDAMNGS